MLKENLVTCLALFCLLARQTTFGVVCTEDVDFKDVDIFQAANISGYEMGRRNVIGERHYGRHYQQIYERESQIEALNNLLVDKTDSVDPQTNFDVLLEDLIKHYKDKGDFDSREARGRRLLLAMQTLEGEHLCDRYGYRIIENNRRAIGTEFVRNEGLRRVDKILAHYLRKRVDKCMPVYLRNFDKILPTLNQTLMKRLDRLLGRLIEDVKGPDSKITLDESDSEKFYHLVIGKIYHPNMMKSADIYDAIKDMAKDDEDARYLQPVENERTGVIGINKEKFDKLYDEYVAKPCKHYKEQLGPDVFEPLHFDTYYGHEIQKDRPDFYEAYYKYSLCENKLVYPEQRALVAEYANGKKFVQ